MIKVNKGLARHLTMPSFLPSNCIRSSASHALHLRPFQGSRKRSKSLPAPRSFLKTSSAISAAAEGVGLWGLSKSRMISPWLWHTTSP
jgi:hypothetical protein